MRKSIKEEKCIQCGQFTNIQLNTGGYACQNCLDEIGQAQYQIRSAIKIAFPKDFYFNLQKIITILELMRDKGCTKTEHCITSLKALSLLDEFERGIPNDELQQELKRCIDIFPEM